MYKFSLSFLLLWTALFVGTDANIYLIGKILDIKLPQIKTSIYIPYTYKHLPTNVHWTFLMATWVWLWPLPYILQKELLNDGNTRLLLQWGSCSLFSNCIKKRIFVLGKFVKRTEKIIFSLVFVCFRFTEISYFLIFVYSCVNMKFSYMIAGCKDEIFYVVL